MAARSRIIFLSTVCALLALALCALSRRDEATATGANADELLDRFERALRGDDPATLEEAWLEVQALGTRASRPAKERLTLAATSGAGDREPMPRWAGSQPSLALWATLLESKLGPSAAAPEPSRLEAPDGDPFTLAWQIEYLALSLRDGAANINRRLLSRRVGAAMKALGRGIEPSSLEYAWLSSALFRAAPAVASPPLEAEIRQRFGKLVAANVRDDAPLALLATRLEAAATFSLAMGGRSQRLDTTIEQLREALVRRSKAVPHERFGEARSIRALRLARAALERGEPIFPGPSPDPRTRPDP